MILFLTIISYYYSILLFLTIISGVGLSHLTGKGKALIEAAMKVGIRKYLTVIDNIIL